MDDRDLLAENFDPATLTIAQLKSALARFDAPVPAKQEKKSVYVALFREHISANAHKLRTRLAAVAPSAIGIQAVSKRGSPNARETERLQQMERDTPTKTSRRSRSERSSFSFENTFQASAVSSGVEESMDEPEEVKPIRRRRSTSRARKKKTPERPARIPSPAEKTANSPKSSFAASASPKSPDKFMVSPDSIKIAGYVDPKELMSRARKRQASRVSLKLAPVVRQVFLGLGIMAALVVILYLQQWRTLPYCLETERELAIIETSVFGVPVPLPQCRICPTHATCDGNRIVKCANGFLIRDPVFPLHPFCAADVAKYAYIEAMAAELEHLLSDHAGLAECGELVDHPYLSPERARSHIRLNHLDLEDERFSSYWDLLMEDIRENEGTRSFEVRKRGPSMVFLSTKPSYPFMCRVTKTITELVDAYRSTLILLFAAMIAAVYSYFRYQSYKSQKHMVLQLVDAVIEALIKQESLFRSGAEERSAVSIIQLRDFFLSHIKSLSERTKLWENVRKELLHNSSVRETVVLVEGEQHDAWQWIGATILSPNSRKSFGGGNNFVKRPSSLSRSYAEDSTTAMDYDMQTSNSLDQQQLPQEPQYQAQQQQHSFGSSLYPSLE